jgi:hypothetical protein
MLVSPLPCVFPLLLVVVPLLFLAKGRKAFWRAAAVSASVLVLLFLWVYVPGWVLMIKAHRGGAAAMDELARWTENHDERLGVFVLWPITPDVLGGYAWLERAAAQDYPPAVWLVGVRLKYGIHVPQPPNWQGAAGNVFPQPERGQAEIDRAIRLGFQPPPDEERYYWQVYRR